MSDTVWVSNAKSDPRQLRPLMNDIGEADLQRVVALLKHVDAGEKLGPEFFPQKIWPSESAKRSWDEMPDIFYAFGYWVLSSKCADVLRKFNLGDGALYPVQVFKKDRKTPVIGNYYCLNFGNVKRAFLPDESPTTRDFPVGRRAMPFVLKDYDIAVSSAALSGPDIWLDPMLFEAIFFSGPLGLALKAAKVSSWFKLKKCRVI